MVCSFRFDGITAVPTCDGTSHPRRVRRRRGSQIDRQELDPDGAIEHQVADDADDLGQHEAGDDSPDEAEKATAMALIPISSV
jgi:hypothetical protein